jgi:release factor glutamine methyltransferase
MPQADSLLKQAKALLSDVETPTLDARLLLQHVTGLSHTALVADPGVFVSDAQAQAFQALIKRRVLNEPVTRILGRREFYGRDFMVTPDVLDPRGDTEVLIEAALALLPNTEPLRILDLGTGSGIIAVTLLVERPSARGVAVDVSAAALAVAHRNAEAHHVSNRLQFITSSWFDGVTGRFDAILSNPPYIEAGAIAGLDEDVRNYDPHLALVGGDDGLACYRTIASQVLSHLQPDGFVAVEIGAGQAADVEAIFMEHQLLLASRHLDLGGHIRCLVFRRSPQSV